MAGKREKRHKKMGIVRSTFIIDKQGLLVDVEYGVIPDGHAQRVLEIIRYFEHVIQKL